MIQIMTTAYESHANSSQIQTGQAFVESRQGLLGANNALKGRVLRGSRSIQVVSHGELLSGGRSDADSQTLHVEKGFDQGSSGRDGSESEDESNICNGRQSELSKYPPKTPKVRFVGYESLEENVNL